MRGSGRTQVWDGHRKRSDRSVVSARTLQFKGWTSGLLHE